MSMLALVAAAALVGCASGEETGTLLEDTAATPAQGSELDLSTYPADIRPTRTRYTENRASCAVHSPLRRAHFGDLHVHTSRSLDAGIQDTRTTPYQAYLFARGERIGIQPWSGGEKSSVEHMLPVVPATTQNDWGATPQRTLQLGRPLDFAMVSDHAEFFGEVQICGEPGLYEREGRSTILRGDQRRGYLSKRCVDLRKDPLGQFVSWNFNYLGSMPGTKKRDKGGISRFESVCGDKKGGLCLAAAKTTWQEAIDAAESAYDKTSDCSFTSFVGYEYTSTPVSENMHRNVVFRNAHVPELPISYMDARYPEILWAALDEQCTPEYGCEALTIPHNSNVSGSRMFRRRVTRSKQGDFDASYARMRREYEPLIEIYQHKGDSECRADNTDELCGFEKFPYNNLIADRFGGWLTGWAKRDAFVRYALGRGLALEAKMGVNPFKYGVIASTDTHLGTPGEVNEIGFPGHGGAGSSQNDAVVSEELLAEAPDDAPPPPPPAASGLVDNIAFSSGGLAVVWAEENSRDFLFDSMQRRETYGTSGPRIKVRFFAGFDLDENMCESVRYDPAGSALESGPFVETAYRRAVPMGGTFHQPPGDATFTPTLAVAALKDPGFSLDDPESDLYERSTPLQQIHIVKGWLDEKGQVHERVVSVAGDPDNGASVDLDTCEPNGSGADALCTVWRDDDFDPASAAYYYARVVENPTCRWSWMQCQNHAQASGIDWADTCKNTKGLPKNVASCCKHSSLVAKAPEPGTLTEAYPETVQERAWTSPIWYRP